LITISTVVPLDPPDPVADAKVGVSSARTAMSDNETAEVMNRRQ
jgi:hypothetical protein